MSHELRTPLNSLLILSKQLKYAQTIMSPGDDLLTLINDILDLSNIESGTVEANISEVALADVVDFLEQTFGHMAKDKKIDFSVNVAEGLPESILTDAQRLQQVLKNLLSNAFKFTDKGRVSLALSAVESGWDPENVTLSNAAAVVAFTVTDTGMGIPDDRKRIIFEAFQQADGSTSRKYGGTGLGLSISREIAQLLGGEITLASEEGVGSTFTLYLPLEQSGPSAWPASAPGAPVPPAGAPLPAGPAPKPAGPAPKLAPGSAAGSATAPAKRARERKAAAAAAEDAEEVNEASTEVSDDRDRIEPSDPVLLVVEDDPAFAGVLQELAHDMGVKVVVTDRGAPALALARRHRPSAFTLDISLPNLSGWRVLDALKNDPEMRHIPVHIVTVDDDASRVLHGRAFGFTTKPVTRAELVDAFSALRAFSTRATRRLLVVEVRGSGGLPAEPGQPRRAARQGVGLRGAVAATPRADPASDRAGGGGGGGRHQQLVDGHVAGCFLACPGPGVEQCSRLAAACCRPASRESSLSHTAGTSHGSGAPGSGACGCIRIDR